MTKVAKRLAEIPPGNWTKRQSRQVGLRQATLAILIGLIVQFALGMGVNLYVALPAAGHPGHASWFGNGALLALHAALGIVLVLAGLACRRGLRHHREPCR